MLQKDELHEERYPVETSLVIVAIQGIGVQKYYLSLYKEGKGKGKGKGKYASLELRAPYLYGAPRDMCSSPSYVANVPLK